MHYFFLDASAVGKRYVVEVGTLLVNHLFKTLLIQYIIIFLEHL